MLDILGETSLISSQYDSLAKDVISEDRILLDDGILKLMVNSIEDT